VRLLLVCLLLLGAAGCHAPSSRGTAGVGDRPALRIATWNLEWLVAPEKFLALRRSCVPKGASPAGRRRSLPCDVAGRLERSTADFAAIAGYARELDADVVALQEVDGPAAARRVFPGHRFCFTGDPAVQNVGFAVRAGVPFRCGADLVDLSLDGRVRRGAELILYPDTRAEIRLLGVHLKSGCGRRTLDSPREQCAALARQVPVLERWIDAQAAAGRAFAVLGDFNRELLRDTGPARNAAGALRSFWSEIDDADPPDADLVNAAEGQAFVNCHAGQNFSGYIDHIVLSRSLAARQVPGSFHRVTFDTQDALRRKLTDHCPVALDLIPRQ
jgi:endonuclease/exonuclease/phosphatase family metal-dependent hydrolase